MRPGNDSPCKDVILKALTRLNDKSTTRVAAEELSIIVRALDQESLSALVQSICTTTGAWEPRPVAKKECVRVLAQLPLASCPVAEAALQQLLPKILGYLRKMLQDADGVVREASSEALAAFAQGQARLHGCAVPGSTASPVVKVVFDCLAEQKKEGQMGASHALLKMSPFLGPLDKELVRAVLKLLKSPSFLGTAQLLVAIASTDAERRAPIGLLKHAASAFTPYINHLVGQHSQRSSTANASTGPGAAHAATLTAGGKPSSPCGILGCLASQDWAVRRAAADAVRALVLLVGPGLEPEGCWGLGDPGSVTGRCLDALEDCRFDKVKEARDTAREAAVLINQLHRFVAEQGPDGDWPAWASSNLPYSGWQPSSPPRSPLAGRSGGSFRQPGLPHMSPIAERFMRAAADGDVVFEPGSRVQQGGSVSSDDAQDVAAAAADPAVSVDPVTGAERLVIEGWQPDAGTQPCSSAEQEHSQQHTEGDSVEAGLAAEQSNVSVSSSVRGSTGGLSKQQSQPRTLWSAAPAAARAVSSTASGSRPGSSQGSRPGSGSVSGGAGSRRTSAHDQQPARAGSQDAAPCPVPSYAAGTRSSAAKGPGGSAGGRAAAAGAVRQPACPVPGGSRVKPSSRPQTAGTWQGPTQQEWEHVQQQLTDHQQLVAQLQQQAATAQAHHAAEVQELREASTTAHTALQERMAALEVQVQRQQVIIQEQRQLIQQQQQHTPGGSLHSSTPSSRRSPARCSSSPSTGAGMAASAAAAIAANSPVGGVLSREAMLQQHNAVSGGPPSANRLYKSAEWGGLQGCSSSGRKSGVVTPIDPLSAGRRSLNCLLTPTSASGGLKSCDAAAVTPGDLEAAYSDAVRGDRSTVHLMRLTQKTGPVWQQLSAPTCTALLEVFIKQDGVMLHRVLPWLWRLADEDQAGHPDVPQDLRLQLLEALEGCPAAEDLQAQEKVCLLSDTLKAVWTAE